MEDNPHDAELTLRALKRATWPTIRVGQGRRGGAGLHLRRERHAPEVINHTPRVILLDLKLPKVDGLEVLRRLKGDERTKIIPVVVLTSSREEQDIVESYRLGVNSYIVKPVDFREFHRSGGATGLILAVAQPAGGNIQPQKIGEDPD